VNDDRGAKASGLIFPRARISAAAPYFVVKNDKVIRSRSMYNTAEEIYFPEFESA